VRRVPKEDFKKEMIERCEAQGLDTTKADLDGIVDQLQIRTKFFSDMPANCAFFFTEDYPFDEKAVEKRLKKPGVKKFSLILQTDLKNLSRLRLNRARQW
jgi:hypothetical protein